MKKEKGFEQAGGVKVDQPYADKSAQVTGDLTGGTGRYVSVNGQPRYVKSEDETVASRVEGHRVIPKCESEVPVQAEPDKAGAPRRIVSEDKQVGLGRHSR